MKRIPWTRFEMLAERLVEGSFRRLFGGHLEPLEVAHQLARALDDAQAEGMTVNEFLVRLHPKDLTELQKHTPNLADSLANTLMTLAQQAGVQLPARPKVALVADAAMSPHHVSVFAKRREADADETTQVYRVPDVAQASLEALTRLDAFLIVNGRRHVPLNQPVINVGRRDDNDVVLDIPTVSRQHAQLRWRYGHFVLFDLTNRGRTAVNGEIVTEHVLQPGDVITLGTAMLIYGEGDTSVRHPAQSQNDDADADDGTLLWPKTS
jgi:hypothetical protein